MSNLAGVPDERNGLVVTECRFFPANKTRSQGYLGNVCFVFNGGLKINWIGAYRNREKGLRLRFPEKQGDNGSPMNFIVPIDGGMYDFLVEVAKATICRQAGEADFFERENFEIEGLEHDRIITR